MVAWPGTLPQTPLLSGYGETPPDLLVRTQMDAGPDKVRRRFTANIRPTVWQFIMTDAQITILDAFYVTDLSGGAIPFDLLHPRTAVLESFRIEKPPTWNRLSGDRYAVQLSLEQMP